MAADEEQGRKMKRNGDDRPLAKEGCDLMAAAFEVHNTQGGGLLEEISVIQRSSAVRSVAQVLLGYTAPWGRLLRRENDGAAGEPSAPHRHAGPGHDRRIAK